MADPNAPEELGPLPRGDRADELEQGSLLALRTALPGDKFRFRDERSDDKGVDGGLELLFAGRFTNIRAQVQLKGTDKSEINGDGSVSYPVAVTNLNYLLNGASPLYLLWIAGRNELRYVWARDEARRLDGSSPGWDQQATVSLRFATVATPIEWDTIHSRVLREGRLSRQIHEGLARAAAAQPFTVRVEPATLERVDSAQAYQTLTGCGLALVAAGHASRALALSRLLSPVPMSEPRIRLVCGYAAASLGHYFDARGHLGHAFVARAELGLVDRFFLDALVLATDFHLGRATDDEFRGGWLHLEREAPPSIGLQLSLDRLRREHLSEPDGPRKVEIARQLSRVVDQIQAAAEAGAATKLEARIVRLFAEAASATTEHICVLSHFHMRAGMGRAPATPEGIAAFRRSSQTYARLLASAAEFIREAVRLQHPLLIVEAMITQAVIVILRVADGRFWLTALERAVPELPVELMGQLDSLLEQAVAISDRAGSAESQVRATLLLADWMDTTGRPDEALRVAESVEGLARGQGYFHHIARIEDFRAGRTEYRRMMSLLSDKRDTDELMAAGTDDEVRQFAEACLAAAELPRARLSMVERECFVMRAVAQEKLAWCRHIEMHQDLRHTLSPATEFACDPDRECVCVKLGHRSRVLTSDWRAIIDGFKLLYCSACADRSPKAAGDPVSKLP